VSDLALLRAALHTPPRYDGHNTPLTLHDLVSRRLLNAKLQNGAYLYRHVCLFVCPSVCVLKHKNRSMKFLGPHLKRNALTTFNGMKNVLNKTEDKKSRLFMPNILFLYILWI
jgi:hypothetical protein